MSDPRDPGADPGRPSLSLVKGGQTHRRLTPREEQFAVDVAAGMEPVKAYLKAYTWNGKPEGAVTEAAKVLRRPQVAARLKELRDQYATRVVEASRGAPSETPAQAYGVAEAMAELDEALQVAKKEGQAAAMVRVVETRMRLYGLGISDAKNTKDALADMTPEDIQKALADVREMKRKVSGA